MSRDYQKPYKPKKLKDSRAGTDEPLKSLRTKNAVNTFLNSEFYDVLHITKCILDDI